MSNSKLSLTTMLQHGAANCVPDEMLEKCAEAERVVLENILLVAQSEINTLNLASTTVVVDKQRITAQCAFTGPDPQVTLSQLRAIETYSPARILDLRVCLHNGAMHFSVIICDSSYRITSSQTEIIRVARKRRFI
jgi:hypothetical protein